jgi:hypothetical protein
MEADIASPTAIVEGFAYAGELTIIAGSPKSGKSVISTQMAIAIAKGGKFLGEFQAQSGHILWYDLDDGNRLRAKERLEDLGHDVENENISIIRSLKSNTDEAVQQIESDLAAAAAAGQKVTMVLVDCLMSVTGEA